AIACSWARPIRVGTCRFASASVVAAPFIVVGVVAGVGSVRPVPVPTLAYSDVDIAVFMAGSSCVIVMWLIASLLRAKGRAVRLGAVVSGRWDGQKGPSVASRNRA
ncbi:hypothetical protein HMPREF1549_02473, partial [Actinomyces johnsonii F0510]